MAKRKEIIKKMFHEHEESSFFTNYSSDSSSSEDNEDETNLMSCLFIRQARSSIETYMETVSQYTDDEFIKHFRISRDLFNRLLQLYERSDEYKKLLNKNVKGPSLHLLVFLWFAGHEACSFSDLSDRFNLSRSTIHHMIRRVTCFVSDMSDEFIKWPSQEEMDCTAEYYRSKYGFPGVVGSIDGTHIRIDPPRSGKDQYYNRKGFISLHVQGICNQNKRFIDVFTGYPGSVHDSRVFQNSPISKKLGYLCKGQYILGDSAYTCQQNLITPYRDHGHLSTEAKNFNHRLSQCRVDIENTFGILKQRFRQLYYCKLQGIEHLCHCIRACCVLHNLDDSEKLSVFDGDLERTNRPNSSVNENVNEISIQDSELGRAIRNKICSELPPK